MLFSLLDYLIAVVLVATGILSSTPLIFICGMAIFLITALQTKDSVFHRILICCCSLLLCLILLIATFIPKAKNPLVDSPTIPKESHIEYEESEECVYITPYGERYHESPTCGGKNSKSTSLEQAISDGYTPCLKCVD